jgi:hypothetical protein
VLDVIHTTVNRIGTALSGKEQKTSQAITECNDKTNDREDEIQRRAPSPGAINSHAEDKG